MTKSARERKGERETDRQRDRETETERQRQTIKRNIIFLKGGGIE